MDFSATKDLFKDHGSNFKWSELLSDTATAFENASALIWQDNSNTLAYKSDTSNDLHVFARFDDSLTLSGIQAALIG